MHDLYSILGVSEDDVDADIRYGITYILREGILDLSEVWVHRPILERFRGYTHQNAVRLQRIAIDRDDCIVFDLGLSAAMEQLWKSFHKTLGFYVETPGKNPLVVGDNSRWGLHIEWA